MGCTFNHSGSNSGLGISVVGAQYGFIFSDCQLFFAAVHIQNSKGIVFNSCNFGSEESLSINGGTLVMFNSCLFGSPPVLSVTNNETVEFAGCYTRNGEPCTNERLLKERICV